MKWLLYRFCRTHATVSQFVHLVTFSTFELDGKRCDSDFYDVTIVWWWQWWLVVTVRVIGDDDVDDENNLVTLVHIWAGGSDKFPEASSQLARTLIR